LSKEVDQRSVESCSSEEEAICGGKGRKEKKGLRKERKKDHTELSGEEELHRKTRRRKLK